MEGDPRVARSREKVLTATVELLAERGYEGVTIEGVADRSGVAKTTIYRHWRGKPELLTDAVALLFRPAAAPSTGDLHRDLEQVATELAETLSSGPLAAAMPSLLAAAEQDRHLGALLSGFAAERRARVLAVLGDRADPDLIGALLAGPLLYRRLVTRQPLTPEFTAEVAGRVARALA